MAESLFKIGDAVQLATNFASSSHIYLGVVVRRYADEEDGVTRYDVYWLAHRYHAGEVVPRYSLDWLRKI